MDINSLKEQFYEDLAEAIKTFSRNEKNRDVYAMVLDCDSDVGGVCLRYQNRPTFESKLEEYKAYEISMVGRYMVCVAVSMTQASLTLLSMNNLRW